MASNNEADKFLKAYLFMAYQEQNVASHGLVLISATSTWQLVRQKWLTDTMRCILTGENPPPLAELKGFEHIIPSHLKLSTSIMKSFSKTKAFLESHWLEATTAFHPMPGLTILEQLNNYQAAANNFMLATKEANRQLQHEFSMLDSVE